MAEVVSTAHDQGIIHRDLKPENVMVISRGGRLSPKLLDLGIARIADDDDDDDAKAAPLADGPIDRLTRDGGITGSPHYMAPEQWVAPRSAGAAADQYALAAIAYETLTGELAFPGSRVFEVARGHAKKPPPNLAASFPPELDAVVTRGLAKKPDERFASVAEFAAAVRDAAGLGTEGILLPELDPVVAADFAEAGPQPIAASVAAYGAATTIHRAHSALRSIARSIVHYLGTLALAARVRRSGVLSDELKGSLAALRQDGLGDGGWLKLAGLLTESFSSRPDVHPIPELVLLFHGDSAAPLGDLFESTLFRDRGGAADDDKLSALRDGVPAIDALLARVRFLSDYPIVCRDDSGVLAWRGARPRRHSQPIELDALPHGEPTCLDATGSVVASLYPLAQIRLPARGAEEEMFLVTGPGRRGARLVSHPTSFACEDESVWPWLANALELDIENDAQATVSERAPYRGLATFSASDSDWFYGREDEAQAFANRLSTTPLLAVVGPSGAGKSSFIKAGVVPILAGDWIVLEMRPGHGPLASLSATVRTGGYELESAAALGEVLAVAASKGGRGILLIVDQFEELFTLCSDADEREQFVAALLGAASDDLVPVRVVITLRDDFLMRAESLPSFGARLAEGLELLGTPSRDGLRRILVEPAARAGFSFESDELVTEMIASVASKPGALPLLSFTAAKLWELRDRHFKTLSRVAYESLGGVGGALAQHAGSILGSMNADEVGLVREAFRHLVTAEGTRAILSRAELEQLLGDDETGRGVIEELIGGRLLVASESIEGAVQIEITHEALLEAWPQLVEWRRKDAENARLRDQLRVAARQWQERDRPRGLLWRSEALAEYKIWRARYPGRLTDVESDFGSASVADASRLRTIRRVVLGTAFVALLVGLVIIYRAEVRASANAELSESRLAQFYREQGRRELAAGNAAHGLVYLSEIADRADSDPTVRFLYTRARKAFSANEMTLRASEQSLFGLGVSADGKRAVTAGEDKTVRIWDLEGGRLIAEMADVHQGVIYSLDIAEDGRAVTCGEDSFAAVFGPGGEVLAKLIGHEDGPESGGIYAARFSRSGDRIVTTGADKTIRLWDAKSGEERIVLTGHEADVFDARFSKDGQRVVSASVDGTVRLWDLQSKEAHVLDVHEGLVWTAQWSADERFIVSTGADGKVVVSDGTTGELLRVLSGHTGWVTDASLSPDSKRVITASRDATSRVFELETGKQVALLSGHTGQVNRAYFVGNDRAVTASADASVRMWSLATGALEEVLVGHTAFIFAAKVAGPERLVTASWDGTARVWNLGRNRVLFAERSDRSLADPASARVKVRSLVQSDGKITAIAIEKRAVELSIDGRRLSINDLISDASALALSKTQLAIGLEDGGIELVSTSDGARQGRLESASRAPVISLVANNAGFTALSADGSLVSVEEGSAPTSLASVPKSELPTPNNGFAHLFAGTENHVVLATARHLRRYTLSTGKSVILASASGDDAEFATVATSGDQQTVATAALELITVIRDGEPPVTLRSSGRPMSLALSNDGALLLAGSESGEIEVWDVRAQTLIDRQPIHGSWITSLAIDPSGHFAISSSADQRAKIFAVRELVVLDTLEPAAGEVYLARFVDGGNAAVVWAPELVMQWDTHVPPVTKRDAERFARCDIGWELADGRIGVRKDPPPAECSAK